jgi:hypothetical protein
VTTQSGQKKEFLCFKLYKAFFRNHASEFWRVDGLTPKVIQSQSWILCNSNEWKTSSLNVFEKHATTTVLEAFAPSTTLA